MKIGMVCYPTVGGSGIIATRLGMALAKRGHEVHFVTYEIPFALDPLQKGIFFHPVKITQYELFKYPDYGFSLAVKLAQLARTHALDLFHVHYAIPHAASACLARTLLGGQGPALVTTLHGTDISLIGRDPAFYELVRHSIQESDAVTAVSDYLRQDTLQTFGIRCPITVIPNFIVPPTTKPPRPSVLSTEGKILIHVSNFRPVKKVTDVVRMFAIVRKSVSAQLVLVGTGSQQAETRTLAASLGVLNDVHFLGIREDVPALLAHSDLFVLPSQQESFGLAALEAMAYGLPVIGTNQGGLPEVVRHGVDGVLHAVGNTEAMAKDAIALLTNSQRYQMMCTAAKKRAAESFHIDAVVDRYVECYKEIAAAHNK